MTEKRLDREKDRIQDEYYDWMTRVVLDSRYSGNLSWHKLLSLLHNTDFTYINNYDRNRAADGIEMRYRFGFELGYPTEKIRDILDTVPCSMLEMMAALAKRCEETITDDPESGDRTGKWFFAMIESLGLGEMDDRHFDKITASYILDRFMRREYQRDGRGGLFTISSSAFDMRRDDIWAQMMHYLNETVYEWR